MPIAIRPLTAGEVPHFREQMRAVFGAEAESEAEQQRWAERFVELVDLQRTYAAFDGGLLVGTAGSFDLELTIPGGRLPLAGLTMVTVQPSHRRRGVLTAMIAAHLEDVRQRGEAISGLWASETSIYGRFGYGVAAEGDDLTFDARTITLDERLASDDIEMCPADRAGEVIAPIFDRLRRDRPGMFARTPAWWTHRIVHDPAERRNRASGRRYAIARRDGAPTGYLSYRQRAKWEHGLAKGDLEITELMAADLRAEATLWRFAANVDLFRNVAWWNAPLDSALPWLVNDRRRLDRRRTDTLWLRLCDIGAALAARAYPADGELGLRVTDPRAPGTAADYTRRVVEGRARCEPGEAQPQEEAGSPDSRGSRRASRVTHQLRLDLNALGGIYLGGFSPSALARAGRIDGAPAALALADRMFSWPVAPWCGEIF